MSAMVIFGGRLGGNVREANVLHLFPPAWACCRCIPEQVSMREHAVRIKSRLNDLPAATETVGYSSKSFPAGVSWFFGDFVPTCATTAQSVSQVERSAVTSLFVCVRACARARVCVCACVRVCVCVCVQTLSCDLEPESVKQHHNETKVIHYIVRTSVCKGLLLICHKSST